MFWLATEVQQLWAWIARQEDTARSIRFPLPTIFSLTTGSCSHRPCFCVCAFRLFFILSPHTFGDHRPIPPLLDQLCQTTKRPSLWPALHQALLSMEAIVEGTLTWNPNTHTHTALIIHSFRAIHNKTWDLLQSNLKNADMSRYIQLAYVCHSIGAKRKTMELVTF